MGMARTQVFHSVFHTDGNILVGSPTGSGKTVTAELAVLRMLRCHPGMKAVYIAPLKALVRERMLDWGRKFVQGLGHSLQELTGDSAPDARALMSAPQSHTRRVRPSRRPSRRASAVHDAVRR